MEPSERRVTLVSLPVRMNNKNKGVMDGTKTTTNWIIAGLVALAVIIGGGWLIARERSNASTSGMASSTVETSTETTGSTKGSNQNTSVSTDKVASASGETVTVLDQPAGDRVIVADVTLSKPSWVVIRDTNKWALGAAWFPASAKSVDVPLLRKTVPGHTYEAVIYVDDGDKQFAVHGGDMMVTGSEGAPVSSTFTAK